jgi:hypothetical protein
VGETVVVEVGVVVVVVMTRIEIKTGRDVEMMAVVAVERRLVERRRKGRKRENIEVDHDHL